MVFQLFMELTEEVVIFGKQQTGVYGLDFSENAERGGRDNPRLKWTPLFQRGDGRGSGKARPEVVPCSHSDSKKVDRPHICEINDYP